VDYATQGSGCQCLHRCEDSICSKVIRAPQISSSADSPKCTETNTEERSTEFKQKNNNLGSSIYQCSSPIALRTISLVSRTRRICKWLALGS
jgi:hypothetical protein